MVELESLVDESEIWLVYGMIEDHLRSPAARWRRRILDNWELTWCRSS
jgi:glutamate synthase (NADPH/NADH) large chain